MGATNGAEFELTREGKNQSRTSQLAVLLLRVFAAHFMLGVDFSWLPCPSRVLLDSPLYGPEVSWQRLCSCFA